MRETSGSTCQQGRFAKVFDELGGQFWSWQHSWQRQHSLIISTESPDSGNPEGVI